MLPANQLQEFSGPGPEWRVASLSNSSIDMKTREKVSSEKCSDPQILTLEETARILRVHRSTVSRYAMSGELRSYLIGSRRLFKLAEILEFFDKRIAPECQVDRRCVFGKEESHGNGDNPKAHS
jgi:excisionase family DNA binding protein